MKRILQIPAGVNGRLTKNNSCLLKLILLVLVLLTGLYTRDYRGDYQQAINNNAGGIFYVIFGSLLISVLFPILKRYAIVLISFGITCIIEIIQYFLFPFMEQMAHHKLPAYLFGSSYNPRDFLFYGIGAICSMLLLVLIARNEEEGPEE